MDLDLELELQYEHIDWNDIVDAEQSGDQDTLEILRNKSVELKRSASLPSPSPPPPPTPPPSQSPHQHKSPMSKTHHFRQPRLSRRPLGPKSLNFQRRNGQTRQRYQRSHSMQNNMRNVLEDLAHSFPSLPKSPGIENSHRMTHSTPPQGITYAQATGQPRASKRTTSDRNCISPMQAPSKRSAIYGTVVTPTALKQSSKWPLMQGTDDVLPWNEDEEVLLSTPQEGATEDMDTSTPDNNSRPVKAGAAQRRLFPNPTTSATQADSKEGSEEVLTDPHRLTQRQKQIDFGKKTVGYEAYIQTIPKWKRQRGHPITPNKHDPCSTRSWQGRIKVWRRALHDWDPPSFVGLATDDTFTTDDASLCNIDLFADDTQEATTCHSQTVD